jgi:hypothetical protein
MAITTGRPHRLKTEARCCFKQVPYNFRMHLTGHSSLRSLPPAGDAGRYTLSSIEHVRVLN